MKRDYTIHHAHRHISWRDQNCVNRNFLFEKSLSEPDLLLTDSKEKTTNKYLHEFIAVDDLYFYRKRKPPDLLNLTLYNNKSEPSIPVALQRITEYNDKFTAPLLTQRPALRRRSTSLKLEGDMNFTTESNSNYNLSHNYAMKNFGKKKSFIDEKFQQTKKPFELIKSVDNLFNDNDNLKNDNDKQNRNRKNQQKCNLKLEGDILYLPEYKSQYIEYPIEKCYSIPQLSNIKFNGNFTGVAEYTDQFRNYDIFSKNIAIKRPDNLNLYGYVDTMPEYKERYSYNKNDFIRSYPIIRNDTLSMKGEFSKILPEYYESFKNPNITTVPEKAKCRKTYLDLRGTTEYNPEYKCTYLDFPRSRPITKKPVSTIRFSQTTTTEEETEQEDKEMFQQKFVKPIRNVHYPTVDDSNLLCQPEYRKAKMELLKRETRPKRMTEILAETADTPEFHGKKKQYPDTSPSFKLMVENVDDIGGTFRSSEENKVSPKYGRRSSTEQQHKQQHHRQQQPKQQQQHQYQQQHQNNAIHNLRNRTKIIEGNHNYIKENKINKLDENHNLKESFIVLKEPCKENNWMKTSWYET